MKFFNKKFYLPLNIFLCLIILFCSSCATDISVIDKSNSDGNNQASNYRIGTNVSFANNSTVNNNYKPAKNWGASEVYTYGLRGIGADVMPIVAFGGPYEPSGTSYNGHVQPNFNEDKYWQLLKDAGVNNICFTWNEYRAETDSVMRALNQAQKFGMTYFVRDNMVAYWSKDNTELTGGLSLEEITAPYINHPACAGVFGRDEPEGSEIESYAKLINEVNGTSKYYGRDVYMNMLPNYAISSAFGKYNSYENYIRGILDATAGNIHYLGYDYYPFTSSKHTLDNLDLGAANFYNNLSFIRRVCNQYRVPFWAYVCVGQYNSQTEYPLYPSKAAYMWCINTFLAYGMKGLQYFSAIQSPVDEDLTDAAADVKEGKNYTRFGFVGGMGNINRWYYYSVEAAQQIQAIDEYMMHSANLGVIATGSRARYLGNGEEVIKSGSFRELRSVSANEAVVGCFDYHGYTLLYVVNNDIDNKERVTLNFDDNYGYDVIQRGTTASVSGNSITLTVEAGEGVFVKLRES